MVKNSSSQPKERKPKQSRSASASNASRQEPERNASSRSQSRAIPIVSSPPPAYQPLASSINSSFSPTAQSLTVGSASRSNGRPLSRADSNVSLGSMAFVLPSDVIYTPKRKLQKAPTRDTPARQRSNSPQQRDLNPRPAPSPAVSARSPVPDPTGHEEDRQALLPRRPSPAPLQDAIQPKEVSFLDNHTVIPGATWRQSQYSMTSSAFQELQEEYGMDEFVDSSPVKLLSPPIMQEHTPLPPPSPSRLSHRAANTHIDVQRHYKQLRTILRVKRKNMRSATRRLRHLEGLAVSIWTCIGLLLAAGSGVVIYMHWPRDGALRDEVTKYQLLIGIVPIATLLANIGFGLLLQYLRQSHLFIRNEYQLFDYSECLNLILNVSRLLVDIDTSDSPQNRHILLEEVTDVLTQAVLLKQRYEASSKSKLFRRTVCKIFFAPAYVVYYFFSGCFGRIGREGKEEPRVAPLEVGCFVYSCAIASCCCVRKQDKWLDGLDEKAQKQGRWGTIVISEV